MRIKTCIRINPGPLHTPQATIADLGGQAILLLTYHRARVAAVPLQHLLITTPREGAGVADWHLDLADRHSTVGVHCDPAVRCRLDEPVRERTCLHGRRAEESEERPAGVQRDEPLGQPIHAELVPREFAPEPRASTESRCEGSEEDIACELGVCGDDRMESIGVESGIAERLVDAPVAMPRGTGDGFVDLLVGLILLGVAAAGQHQRDVADLAVALA